MGEPVAAVDTGKLLGRTASDLEGGTFYCFQGIPYAKPPIGNLRFKAPEPPEPWTGIRDATTCGSECLSRHPLLQTLIGGEDCLVLNVYTPALPNQTNDLKPVMFWIHGGGFTSGSADIQIYGPEFLVSEDVILVTINYRTGILGFFSLEDPSLGVPGNAGLKDMVMALKWVQRNIRNFCGDPNNVTIFGESAGAAAVHYLILSPLGNGLFHKAILQSGCLLNVWAKGKRNTEELCKILDIKATNEGEILEILRALPAKKLIKAAEKFRDVFLASWIRPHGFVIEKPSKGAFLTEDPLNILKSGRYNHVPILTGYTTREGMLSEVLQKPRPFEKFHPLSDFELAIPYVMNLKPGSDISKLVAKKIKEFYYGDQEPTTSSKDIFYVLESDNFFIRDLFRTIRYHLETSPMPIYLYRMSVESDLNMFKVINEISEPGVSHADDLGYLFKTVITPELESGSVEDVSVRRFKRIWANFAKYANPNPSGKDPLINVQWKPVKKNEFNFVDIGEELTVGVNPEPDRMAFWDEILKMNANSKL